MPELFNIRYSNSPDICMQFSRGMEPGTLVLIGDQARIISELR